jgi:two-component system KDP operon response regulator KdpE
MSKMKNGVLVVDDEEQIRKMLSVYLEISDFAVEQSNCGKQAIRMAVSVKPDIILLDLGLPDMDGKEVISQIRQWSQVPIIVLSARTADKEMVSALEGGADDYVCKPFNVDVLVARMNVELRRAKIREAGEPELTNGAIRMDLVRHEVYRHDEKIDLTPKEYELLRCFLTNLGKVLTHRHLLHQVWGPAHVGDVQYLRVYIGQIREKLTGRDTGQQLIVTAPGIGYIMERSNA